VVVAGAAESLDALPDGDGAGGGGVGLGGAGVVGAGGGVLLGALLVGAGGGVVGSGAPEEVAGVPEPDAEPLGS
jgi:hypothetical protein